MAGPQARSGGGVGSAAGWGARDSFFRLNAHERHTLLMSDYLRFYGGAAKLQQAGGAEAQAAVDRAQQLVETDFAALAAAHRFIRTAEDDADPRGGYGAKLAKRYYDRLYREYCIADLSRYKESKIGLRWRTHSEVISGKGQFICGVKGCNEKDGLASYEVNFAYKEAGEAKQALVKLRCCPGCAYKLNYKREKQFKRLQAVQQEQQRKRKDRSEGDRKEEPGSRGRKSAKGLGWEEGEDKEWVAPTPGRTAGTGGGVGGTTGGTAGGTSDPSKQEQVSVLPADDSVWEAKPAQEVAVSLEEEVDAYLEAMFA